jgi:hypothetical protein
MMSLGRKSNGVVCRAIMDCPVKRGNDKMKAVTM